jgi:hypothetical protein
VAGPKPTYLFPVPLLEWKSEIDSFILPKPVKVLIIWIPTGKTHFLWHLEVRRVIFYPTMKFALLFLAEGSDLHALWVVRLHLWMVGHPFEIKGWLGMSRFWEGLRFVLHQTWARHKIRGSKYFLRWGRHGNFREFTPNGVNSMSGHFLISNCWWILALDFMNIDFRFSF